MQKIRIKIPLNGPIEFIYNDLLAPLLKEGESIIERVSNVEPTEGGWTAFINDGVKLGPYPLRQTALDAEVKYIEEKMFEIK